MQRVGGDVLDEVVGGDELAALLVPEDRVGGGVAGTVEDLQAAVAQLEHVAVVQRARDLDARPPGPEGARDAAQRHRHVGREAVAQHEPLGEGVVGLVGLGEALEQGHELVQRRHLGPRAPSQDLRQPLVVEVLVGDDDELEVLDLAAVRGQRLLELVEGLARVRAGVDQRERVVLDEVDVDPAHGERRGDREAVDHERISASTSSRFSSMCSRETSDSRLRRSSGSVLDGRTLKCQSA